MKSNKNCAIIIIREVDTLAGKSKQKNKLKHWWHAPFFQGLIAVLDPKEEYFNFNDEHRLSKDALRIDVVVSAKNGVIPQNHAISKIFRKHNLFEYNTIKEYFFT